MQDVNNGNKNEYMSADELKSRLFERFRDIGALDGLQVQLRGKLINEMFKAASGKSHKKDKKTDSQTLLLPLQVSNWLVYDHLKCQGFEYSLSTFMSESKLSNPEDLLSIADILHVFGYDNQSLEYSFLYKDYIKRKKDSFLLTFLTFMVKRSEVSSLKGASGDQKHNKRTSLPSFHPSKVLGDIFNNGNLLGNDVAENEVAQSLQRQLQQQQEKHENEIHSLRQRLIKEVDALHEQEQQARLEIEETKNKLLIEKEMLDIKTERLKWKELEVLRKSEHLEQKIKVDQKNSEEDVYSKKVEEMKNWEIKLKEQQQWLEQELAKIKTSNLESDHVKTQLHHMENSYKSLEAEYAGILQENENLRKKLKDMADYSTIKEELSWKSKKLNSYEVEMMLLQSELQAEKSTSLDTIRNLQRQLLLTVSKRTEPVHPDFRFGHRSFAYGQQETGITESDQMYNSVVKRIEEQRGDISELHKLVHDLYRKICENKESTSTNQQKVQSSHKSQSQNQSKVQSSQSTTHAIEVPEFSHIKLLSEKPFEFIEKTKQRINSIDKEARDLEKRYSELLLSQRSKSPPFSMPVESGNVEFLQELESIELAHSNLYHYPATSGERWNYPSYRDDFRAEEKLLEELKDSTSEAIRLHQPQYGDLQEMSELTNFDFNKVPTTEQTSNYKLTLATNAEQQSSQAHEKQNYSSTSTAEVKIIETSLKDSSNRRISQPSMKASEDTNVPLMIVPDISAPSMIVPDISTPSMQVKDSTPSMQVKDSTPSMQVKDSTPSMIVQDEIGAPSMKVQEEISALSMKAPLTKTASSALSMKTPNVSSPLMRAPSTNSSLMKAPSTSSPLMEASNTTSPLMRAPSISPPLTEDLSPPLRKTSEDIAFILQQSKRKEDSSTSKTKPKDKSVKALGSGDAPIAKPPETPIPNTSPFRRRRIFNFPASPQGGIVVDLNAEWKRKNSQDLTPEELNDQQEVRKSPSEDDSSSKQMITAINVSGIPYVDDSGKKSPESEIVKDNSSKETSDTRQKMKSSVNKNNVSGILSQMESIAGLIGSSHDMSNPTSKSDAHTEPGTPDSEPHHQNSSLTENEVISDLSETNLSIGSIHEQSASENSDKNWWK